MKAVAIMALVLGLSGLGVGVYHLVETYPNVKAFERRAQDHHDTMTTRLWMMYRRTGFNQIYAMWALGGLGLICGVLGAIKNKEKLRLLAVAGASLSVAAVIISCTTLMASRLG